MLNHLSGVTRLKYIVKFTIRIGVAADSRNQLAQDSRGVQLYPRLGSPGYPLWLAICMLAMC